MRFGPVPVMQAEGKILAHSLFGLDGRKLLGKGHVLTASDLERLTVLNLDSVVVAELEPTDLGENDAAKRVGVALAGPGVRVAAPGVGRANLIADIAGPLRLNVPVLDHINNIDEGITVATLRAHTPVRAGQLLALVKIIPFSIPAARVVDVEAAACEASPIIAVRPLPARSAVLIVSGSESTRERLLEDFTPPIRTRIENLGSHLDAVVYVEHTAVAITAALREQSELRPGLILLTGISAIIDRQDVIPRALDEAGGSIAHFGAPVDPGSLLMLGYLGDIPVVGAPGCVKSLQTNVIDWILPRLLAGERLTRADIVVMGHGGLLEDIRERPMPRQEDSAQAPAESDDSTLQQTNQLRALYQLSVELSALRSLESVLKTALKHCLDLTGSQFGFIGLIAGDRAAMDVVEVQGFHPAREFYDHFRLIPLRPNLFSRVVLDNEPVRTADAVHDPRRVGQPRGHPGVKTFLGVPLRIRETPIGMIGVANRKLPYELEHERLLMTYAAQVAIVIRNAQLYEELVAAKADLEQKVAHRTGELQTVQDQLRQLFNETVDIQETERQRIAQDMHDGINQLLIGAMLELKSGRERLSVGNLVQADDAFEAVQGILRNVETEIKRVIYDLRPPTLDALGFVSELRRYIQDFRQYTNLNCIVTMAGENVRLPAQVEVSIYRLAQEVLQNVYNHACAHNVEINIYFTPDRLELSIRDDGTGFDLNAVERTDTLHFGLTTMRERAKSLNGDLTIQTQPGHGTCVTLSVPSQPGSRKEN